MAETKNITQAAEHADHVQLRTVALFAFSALVPIMILVSVVGIRPPQAQALDIFGAFGGRIIGYFPIAIENPVNPAIPICPAHIIIANFVNASPQVIGLFVNIGGVFRYDYANLFNGTTLHNFLLSLPPETALLGKNNIIPYPSCPVPYPVLEITNITGVYYMGTALHP